MIIHRSLIYYWLLLSCLMYVTACSNADPLESNSETELKSINELSQEEIETIIHKAVEGDILERKVMGRLASFDHSFFAKDSSLWLTSQQKEALKPILEQKVASLDELKKDNILSKITRDSIRSTSDLAIDDILNEEQKKARQEVIAKRKLKNNKN